MKRTIRASIFLITLALIDSNLRDSSGAGICEAAETTANAQPVRSIIFRASSRGGNAAEFPFQLGVARFFKDGVLFYEKTGGGGGGRGFNVAAIDPATGNLLQPAQNFDTWGTRSTGTAMNAMIAFLNGLPNGTLVLIAVADEAGLNLDNSCAHINVSWVEAGLQTLEALGSQQIRNYCFRSSFAMAAFKGEGVARSEQLADGLEASAQTALAITVPCPTVNDISPTNGIISSIVSITGSNFSEVQSVSFSNNVSANFTTISDSQISATVPLGALTGPVTVSRPGCADVHTNNFTVLPVDSSGPGPSEVIVKGRQLTVRKRNANGTLAAAETYIMTGVNWSPASRETNTTPFDPNNANVRRPEFGRWANTDAPLMKSMSVNTVRLYIDPGFDSAGRSVLDQLYSNGIMVILTVDDAINDETRLEQVVSFYKNHPAILMWMLGSEWNINRYFNPNKFPSIIEAARATERAAQRIKTLDANHPVATSYGEIDINADGLRLADTVNYVKNICPNVDVWSLNIYRGNTFGNLFSQWASITDKPMFIGEFGTDAFRSSTTTNPPQGAVDEDMQAEWDVSLWNHILVNLSAKDASQVALGGLVFEFNDEFWKVAPPASQQPNGFTLPNGHPDSFANEEYFGAVTIDRTPRQVFNVLATAFENARKSAPEIADVDFNGKKKLTIQGSRFSGNSRVIINGADRTDLITSVSETTIRLKGKKKKLGLVTGDNAVQIIDANIASNVFVLRL